jgi:hypothetical protein
MMTMKYPGEWGEEWEEEEKKWKTIGVFKLTAKDGTIVPSICLFSHRYRSYAHWTCAQVE